MEKDEKQQKKRKRPPREDLAAAYKTKSIQPELIEQKRGISKATKTESFGNVLCDSLFGGALEHQRAYPCTASVGD